MNKYILKIIGSNIAYYREQKQITVGQLAKHLINPPHYVREVEAGTRGMNVTTLVSYAKILDVPVHELVRDNRDKQKDNATQ